MIWLKIALNFATLYACFVASANLLVYTRFPEYERDAVFPILLIQLGVCAALLTALAYFPA